MKIESFQADDLKSLSDIQPPDWTDIIPHYRFYLSSLYCLPYKIKEGELLLAVGTIVLHEDTAWLAHIVVHPLHRKRGIGKLFTAALIDQIDSNHYKTIYLMATPMGEPVYRQVGFEPETEHLYFNEGRPFTQYTIPVGIMPYNEQYQEPLLLMDKKVSGESRAIRLNEHLSDAWVFVSNGEFKGYYMPGLSEGLVVALDEIAGLQLMQFRLLNHALAILPVDNTAAARFLDQQGYKVFRKARRMRLGEYRTWHPAYIYNRVSGQIG